MVRLNDIGWKLKVYRGLSAVSNRFTQLSRRVYERMYMNACSPARNYQGTCYFRLKCDNWSKLFMRGRSVYKYRISERNLQNFIFINLS